MVESETRERLAELNALLAPALGGMRLDMVDPRELEHAPKNARFMTNEQFTRLVSNVKRDKALSSIPLCWEREPGVYRVLSGNHRVKAAKAAGLTQIVVLVISEEMSRDHEIGVQLSHNAISGQDDPQILKELWDEISAIDEKLYAGLDDKTLGDLQETQIPSLSEAVLDFRAVTFLFLPEEVDELEERLQAALDVIGNRDVFVARLGEFSRLMAAQAKVMDSHNVRNAATSLFVLLELFDRHEDELRDGWDQEGEGTKHGELVPLSSVFGTDRVPVKLAKKLATVCDTLMARGELESAEKWRALDRLRPE